MAMRNLPTDAPALLSELVAVRPGQVSSMALSGSSAIDMTLLAFAEGESVSEEEYFGDTLYFIVEGAAVVVLPDRRVSVRAGEVFMVPAHVVHAVESDGAFKVLQITIPE